MPDSVPLRGSAYHPAGGTRPGHRRLRKLDEAELQADAGVTLMLRERTGGPTTAQSLAWLQSLPDRSARHMDITQLTARHGFDPADRDRVVRWAGVGRPAGHRRGRRHPAGDAPRKRRAACPRLRGRPGAIRLADAGRPQRRVPRTSQARCISPRISIGVVEGVYGLDDRPAGALARARAR